jgi:hypothetical protein
MENQDKSNTTIKKGKALRVIVENSVLGCVDRANMLRVTDKEFVSLTPIQGGYVLLYYR